MVDNGVLSQKDMGKSLFAVWEEIFNAPSAHNRMFDRYKTTDINDRYVNRLSRSIMCNGEFERLMQGCFESYLKMRYNDVGCQKIVQMSEWLDLYDHLDTRSNILHDYSFYSYLPYPIVNFHRFFAGSSTQEHRVEYPKTDYEQYVLSRQYQNLMDVFLAGVHPRRRFGLDKMTVVNELVPRRLYLV
ncbi:hypothetical protein BX666DRAFT_620520 [Dichotomocladium elegans]|nr:hypothetical protein BX666DRAFT_620520 [Dichotomocladium elegans]